MTLLKAFLMVELSVCGFTRVDLYGLQEDVLYH